ncbi:MAG: tetrahydromethanopterin S-methyltransferase subunit H [Candidatus Bathyarchaeia archaeon]
MFLFKAEQKVFQIGNVTIGGQPGEYPTVLMGSIFYSKHEIVKDAVKGEFDRKAAEDLLNMEEKLSEETGIPCIIDVLGETNEALCKYIDFIADHTDSPFLIDSSNPSVRIAALKHVEETGLIDRAIYNSIDEHIKEDEINALRSSKIKSAVILAFSTKYLMPKDRLQMLEGDEKNLIKIAKEAGIENILIDPGVLDVPTTGWAANIIYRIKQELGYPTGCAPSNALYMWLRKKKIASPLFEGYGACILTLPIMFGADFIIYGPMKNAKWVYPICAVINAIIAYHAKTLGITPKTKNHPLYKKIF